MDMLADELTAAAPVFAAMGDATRLGIVLQLCGQGPLPIVRLAAGSKVSRQAAAKHLQALEQAGLVRSVRSGRERIWEMRRQGLDEAGRALERISRQWDEALARLRAQLEAGSQEELACTKKPT